MVSLLAQTEQARAISLKGPVNDFLLVGTGSASTVGDAVTMNNWQLGAIRNNSPSGSNLNPELSGNKKLPSNAALGNIRPEAYQTGPSYKGNVAVTNPNGTFNFNSKNEVYANLGWRTRQNVNNTPGGSNNANQGLSGDTKWDDAAGGSGLRTPTIANGGLKQDIPLTTTVQDSINQFAIDVLALSATGSINASAVTANNDYTVNLVSGLNVIDLVGNSDFLLNNMNFIINGGSDAFAIFRVRNNRSFLISNSNIVRTNAGIGANNILFWSPVANNTSAFSFSNAFLDSASFWSTGSGGGIKSQNVRGCTQYVGDKLELSDNRLDNCGFSFEPEVIPTPALLPGLIGMGIAVLRKREDEEVTTSDS